MNRMILAAISVAVLIIAASAVMGWDATKDGGHGQTEETDGNDQYFQWPRVSDPDTGSITLEHQGDTETFVAVPAIGYEFVRWVNLDGTTFSERMYVSFPIDAIEMVTAEFGPLPDNKVVEYHWALPQFGEDGSVVDGVTSDEVFTMTIPSLAWSESMHDDNIHRHAEGDVLVPSSLVTDDIAVQAIVQHLEPKVAGLTDLQKSIVIMYFVQGAVGYLSDSEQYPDDEFWTTPMETMYSGFGDCEDTAVLFVSVAEAMGLDAGLVSFEDPEAGHMAAAVALETGVTIDGTTFTIGDTTYVFVETADSGTIVPIGGLDTDRYPIENGKWTDIDYVAETDSFAVSETVAIGNGIATLSYGVVYGDSFSQPPTIPLSVGDTFTYVPTTSLPSVIVASGSGIVGTYGGSFLTWDADTETLSGTATQPGHYTVTLSATWTHGELQQVATQVIEFEVSEADAGYASQDKELVYAAGEWSIETITTEPVDPDDGIPVTWIAAGILAVVIAGIIVLRVVA